MITKDSVNLRDDLEAEYGVPYGFEYKDSIFIFESAEERQEWLDTCSTEDLDNVLELEVQEITEV